MAIERKTVRRRPAILRREAPDYAVYFEQGKESLRAYEKYSENTPFESSSRDRRIAQSARDHTRLNADEVLIRYFFHKTRETQERCLGAFVFCRGDMYLFSELDWREVRERTNEMLELHSTNRQCVMVDEDYACLLWRGLIGPIWKLVTNVMGG